MENVRTVALHFKRTFIKLADNKDMHKISDKLDWGPVLTIGMRVTCPRVSHRLGKCCADNSNSMQMGKWCLHASMFIFDGIIIKVGGNQDRLKSLVKFDFRPLFSMAQLTLLRYFRWRTVNPFYNDTRYNNKIRYNDNLNVTKPSLKKWQLMRNYARILQ